MAPILKEAEASISAQPNLEGNPLVGGKAQAAAAEISVTVNGARTAATTNKREPFSENTSTVLVFPKGAVIRLSSAVTTGQLLFLTNEKTKKEVVCQVVKAKSEGSASGYVELQFTEPAVGFWGMRFPGSSPATSLPIEPKPLATIPAPATQSLDEKLAEMQSKPTLAPPVEEAISVARQPDPEPAPEVPQLKSENTVAIAPAVASGIPTLSQFLAQGETGPELRIAEKSNPDTNGSKPEASVQELRAKTEELQKSLSTQLVNSQPRKPKEPAPPASVVNKPAKPAQQSEQKESLSKLLLAPPAAFNPAPGTSTFDFAVDEVKIPAWLEPLARNSALPSPAQELKSAESYEPPANSVEDWAAGDKTSETLIGGPLTAIEAVLSVESAGSGRTESALSSEGPTPNFGSSLALDRKSTDSTGVARGSSNGLLFGLLAGALLLAAGGGWYWYSNQPAESSTSETNSVKSDYAQPAAATTPSNSPVSESARPFTPAKTPATDANHAGASLPLAHTDNKGIGVSSGSSPKSSANDFAPSSSAAKPAMPEPEKKPSMGKLHLAAPVMNHRAADSNATSDSGPALNGSGVSGIDAGNLGALSNKSNQPVAPLAVGGDVKPALLLSSVPPVYPQLAKAQRLGGDVKIDALIDARGRVSSTKIISGPALLQQAAMDAVRQWKYQPATLNGTAMPMHLAVTVQFKMQ